MDAPIRRHVTWLCALLFAAVATSCNPHTESVKISPGDSLSPNSPNGLVIRAPQILRDSDGPAATPVSTRRVPTPDLTTATSLPVPSASATATVVIIPGDRPSTSAEDGPSLATNIPESTPTLAPTSTPPPTPVPALREITTGGCCTQISWSADSRQILFIDKPTPGDPVGIWGVDVTKPAAEAELVTERIAYYTADMAYLVDLDADTTTIERVADPSTGQDGTRWTVPAGGRPVSISPGRKLIAWQESDENLSFDRRTTEVWVASLDGGDHRRVTTLTRGGLGGWISDDTLLVSGRESSESQEQVLYALSVTGDRVTELARAERLRSGLLSPDGAWLVYSVTLNQDPTQNGLWLARTDGTNQLRLDRRLFGSYRWRDSNRLLIVPLQPEAEFHELWELDVETNESRRLTDAEVTPFKIANGDWTVSPDGKHMAFVESRDDNIWLLTLPDWEKHAP